jgi:hypothetical protein
MLKREGEIEKGTGGGGLSFGAKDFRAVCPPFARPHFPEAVLHERFELGFVAKQADQG